MRIFHNANYDFMGKRKKMYLLSSAVILFGFIILFAFKTIPLGIDFIGGTAVSYTHLDVYKRQIVCIPCA